METPLLTQRGFGPRLGTSAPLSLAAAFCLCSTSDPMPKRKNRHDGEVGVVQVQNAECFLIQSYTGIKAKYFRTGNFKSVGFV